ncbi:hypothetical protein GGR55DRAFT_620338 [Xylaria sp. FL0064]|nr:hypothetical protein GGR55DRAFT_620338 [Xylaria sp. FL0064]
MSVADPCFCGLVVRASVLQQWWIMGISLQLILPTAASQKTAGSIPARNSIRFCFCFCLVLSCSFAGVEGGISNL